GLADLDRLLDTNNPLNADLKRSPPSFSIQYIGMNVNEPPLDDIKVRQALNLAIDKQEIATIVLGGQVVPAKGILPPGFPAYDPNLIGYEFDPERARRLLAESKYGSDLENIPPIVMTSSGSFGAAVTLDMEVVLQMWEKNLGLRVDFQRTEFATFLRDLHKRRFQMFVIGWIADYPDPENFLDILFQSESSNNHTNYDSPQVDALLLEARTETDETRRFALYNQAERLILEDAPWVPLWYSGERYILVKPNVQDYYQTPLVIPRLRYVYLTDR
ncbi:MAG: peptide ABC transporter substrate-binding protein, partial [Chloroflexi bacterium]|nr:peptide ABC transporter substrate-binding protein [Chloroflexota bacterium]